MLFAAIVSVHPFGDRLRPGTGAAFVVLIAFVVSFLAIRTSARLTRSVSWWPGGVQSGDVHIHHLVWGICLMMLTGFLAFAAPLEAPWWHFIAIGFGVGAGLTLDEFALWVRLAGRLLDAGGAGVPRRDRGRGRVRGARRAGHQPFGLDDPASITGTAVAVALVLGLAVMLPEGPRVVRVVGLFVPVVALVGAVRLANPSSLVGTVALLRPRLERSERALRPHPPRDALAAQDGRPHRRRA